MPEFGPADFLRETGVSQKTFDRLQIYAELLLDWNKRHNLVARSTLPDLWRRHFWDSAQIEPLIPTGAQTLADLGSGAGFPGLVLASMRPDIAVTLHESIGKKCDFLREAAARMDIPVRVVNSRIEAQPTGHYDVITARALAALPQLLAYARPLMGANSVCLFLKGQNLGSELTEAHKCWKINSRNVPSKTDPSGAILVVNKLVAHEHPSPKAPDSRRRQPEGRRR